MNWFSFLGSYGGIGGAIIGGITSICSAIATGIGAMASTIGHGAATIGSNIVRTFAEIVPKSPTIEVLDIIKGIADVISVVLSVLDVNISQDPAELGYKAEIARKNGKTIEDFDDDTLEYIKYLENEIQLTKEQMDKLKNMSDEDRLKYAGVGIGLAASALAQKCGVEITGKEIYSIIKVLRVGLELGGPQIANMLSSLGNDGVSLNDVSLYLQQEGNIDHVLVGEALEKSLIAAGIESNKVDATIAKMQDFQSLDINKT